MPSDSKGTYDDLVLRPRAATSAASDDEVERRRRANYTAIEEPTIPKSQPHIHDLSIEVEPWPNRRYWQCACGFGPVDFVFRQGYIVGVHDAATTKS